MSASAVAFVRFWSVGEFTATLSCPRPQRGEAMAAVIEWAPHVPTRLTPEQVRDYREGRDAALRELSAHFGLSVGVIEV